MVSKTHKITTKCRVRLRHDSWDYTSLLLFITIQVINQTPFDNSVFLLSFFLFLGLKLLQINQSIIFYRAELRKVSTGSGVSAALRLKLLISASGNCVSLWENPSNAYLKNIPKSSCAFSQTWSLCFGSTITLSTTWIRVQTFPSTGRLFPSTHGQSLHSDVGILVVHSSHDRTEAFFRAVTKKKRLWIMNRRISGITTMEDKCVCASDCRRKLVTLCVTVLSYHICPGWGPSPQPCSSHWWLSLQRNQKKRLNSNNREKVISNNVKITF